MVSNCQSPRAGRSSAGSAARKASMASRSTADVLLPMTSGLTAVTAPSVMVRVTGVPGMGTPPMKT